MKILFLNPPFLKNYSRQSRSPCVTKGGTLYFPYYLAYAAGASEVAGFHVKLLDAVAENITHEQTVKVSMKFGPQLIVVDTSTPSILNDVKMASELKQSTPNAHITLVNTHPTNLPEETLGMSQSIGSVARGEFDYTVRDLVFALESGSPLSSVLGLSYRENEKIIHNAPRPPIENLDELPFVSYVYKRHLGEKLIKKYFYASICWPYIQMLTARGCPYACTFCNIPEKNSYRTRSVSNVVDEFEFIKSELPFVNEIFIEDDTFPISAKRTNELCDTIIQRKIEPKWSCNARVNTDLSLLRKMKAAGCRLLCVGFESPEQDVLNGIRKGTTLDMQSEFMKNTRSAGLLVNGCFILGLPNDTPESMSRTIDFSKSLAPNTAQFYPLMIYPGTPSWNWAEKNGYIFTRDWSRWLTADGLHSTVVSRVGMPPEELLRWCNRARLEFYTDRKYLFKMVAQAIRNPDEAVRITKGGTKLLKHMIGCAMTGGATPKYYITPAQGHDEQKRSGEAPLPKYDEELKHGEENVARK